MSRAFLGIAAVVILLLNVVGGLIVPGVAESIIAEELQKDLSERFGGEVTVEVDVAAPAPLLRGEIARVQIQALGVMADLEGELVALGAIDVDLRDVEVDVRAAIDGRLDEARLGSSVVQVDVWEAVARRLALALNDPQAPVTLREARRADGHIAITLVATDGSDRLIEVQATPVVRDGSIIITTPPPSDPDDLVEVAARDAVEGLSIGSFDFPLGIVIEAVRIVPSEMIVLGTLPDLLDLS